MRGTRFALVLLLAALGGCGAFRASAGPAFGLGGSVHAGPADAGFLGGISYEFGNAYGAVGSQVTLDLGIGIARLELLADGTPRKTPKDPASIRIRGEGILLQAAYPLWKDSDAAPFIVERPSEVAISFYALFFAVHLGFDPVGLAHDVSWLFRAASGGDLDDSADGWFRETPPPEDGLQEPPYTLVTADDLASLDSGTVVERAAARRRIDRLLQDPLALYVEALSGEVEHAVPVRDGIIRRRFPDSVIDELAEPRQEQAATAFERAIKISDPEAIEEALHAFPFASSWTHAARVRAELLVERGDLEEAAMALEDLSARDPSLDDDDTHAARLLVPRVKALREALPRPASGQAWSGSANLGGYFIGASGQNVWAMTPGGDVAWERSDAFAAGFYARRVLGASSDLALVEAFNGPRAWVIAIDDHAVVKWKVPLPAPAAGCGPLDQLYALGEGRLYVCRTDRVIAIEASSGRLLWMHARHDPEPLAKKVWREAVPMDWRPPIGPPARRPDGSRGFSVKLTPDAIEVSSGTGRRVEKLDARTGELLTGD